MTEYRSGDSKQRLPEIDGIRGWAACIVVMNHLLPIIIHVYPILDHPTFLFFNGPLAVCIFFVLSGDALSASYFAHKQRRSIDKLLLKRYPRLTFAILLGCLALYAVNVLGLNFIDQGMTAVRHYAWHGTPANDLWGILAYSFYHIYLLPPESPEIYHPYLWTMRIEFFGSLGVFVILYLWPYIYMPALLLAALAAVFFVPLPGYAAFAVGMLFGWLRNQGFFERAHKIKALQIISIVLLGVSVWLTEFIPAPMPFYILLSFAAIFVGLIYSNEGCLVFFRNRVSRFLGDLSFPLYVMHYAVLISLTSFLIVWCQGQFGLNPLTVAGIVVLSIVASLTVAWLVRQIEKPYLRLLDISVKYMLKDK